MANKKIEVDIIIESEDSQKKLRELTKALKQLPAGTDDWKKVYGEIDDLKDRLEGAKAGTDDWVDSLQNAGGPLGMVGAGINKMKVAFSSFNTALKASIIGLIVAAIGGLVAAFAESIVSLTTFFNLSKPSLTESKSNVKIPLSIFPTPTAVFLMNVNRPNIAE